MLYKKAVAQLSNKIKQLENRNAAIQRERDILRDYVMKLTEDQLPPNIQKASQRVLNKSFL